MQPLLLFAATLLIRNLAPVGGVVECPLAADERLLAAYSVSVSPVHSHATRESQVDRLAAARTGRVDGLGDHHLVLAVVSSRGTFDPSRTIVGGKEVFPYSDAFVKAYAEACGRDFVTDMMLVVVPFCNNGWARDEAVRDFLRTAVSFWPSAYACAETTGPVEGRPTALVFGRVRTLDWLDGSAYGDDGRTTAERLAASGVRLDRLASTALDRLSLDEEGWVVLAGRRLARLVLWHLDARDARAVNAMLAGRRVRTEVVAYDSPTIASSRIAYLPSDLMAGATR